MAGCGSAVVNQQRSGDMRSCDSDCGRLFDERQTHGGVLNMRRRDSKLETLTCSTLQGGDDLLLSNNANSLPCSSNSKNKRKRGKSRRSKYRKWTFSSRGFSGCEDKVVIVSYNILGAENVSKHPDLYSEVHEEFMTWGWRKKLIQEEVRRYNPSIMCFQEVDRFNDMNGVLRKDGFKGIYKARTGEAFDGCAIFWNNKRFSLLHQESIEFRSFGLRDNVAQLCVLKMRRLSSLKVNPQRSQDSSGRCLLVGNIHVLYNPKRGDIKLGQVRLFLQKAHELSQNWGGIPVVIAGDLNSLPQSAMYQFLSSSELDIRLHDRSEISGQDQKSFCRRAFRYHNKHSVRSWAASPRPVTFRWSDEEIKLATGSERNTLVQHHLKISSAYVGVPGSDQTRDRIGEPLATSYHSKFMGTVDYIWHTKELAPVRVLETLPIGTLRNTRGLPSKEWGSDHLAVVCELAFVDLPHRPS